MAFTISVQLPVPPDQVLAAVAGLAADSGRPPMPASVRGRLAQVEFSARVRGAEFLLDYRSRVRPGPWVELWGRAAGLPGGGTRVEARVGLVRWLTTYNGWIVAALALPFAWQGSWRSAAGFLAVAAGTTAINRGLDAGITRENEDARYLAACLEHALAALTPHPGPESRLQEAAT